MSRTIGGSTGCRVVLSVMLMLLMATAVLAKPPENADIRVLIDISGSMRQNDPDNLRRPALRMLAGLMQPGTRAGVWTFARWVNNLVPVAEVDSKWKKRTQSLSKQISSPGQFTNIEEVLDRASRDWRGGPGSHARHLVLLTDGMVDVSKKAADNAQSRARIVDTLLPQLKSAGVKVHTIALSERADHALMKRLAGETGGWYQQVEKADELQRVFLKMFETVGKPDAIPLQDNRFTVDSSIREATVLVFSKEKSSPVVLHAPNGDQFTDSDLTAGVAWYRDQGYDLITIVKPGKGEWRLQADIDPDNRVMIVTDLKLQTSELPNHLAIGEQVHVEAHLSNSGNLVKRKAFLRLLEVRADAITSDGTDPQPLNDQGRDGDSAPGDGRYGMRFAESQQRASVELLVSVDSPTFMREKRFRLAVHEPAAGTVVEGPDGLQLTLKANRAVLQPGGEVEVWQQDAAGARQPLAVEQAGDGEWTARLGDPGAAVYASIAGTSRLGNLLQRTLGPILPPGVTAPPVVELAPAEEAAPVVEEPAAQSPAPEPPAKVVDEAPGEVVAEDEPVEQVEEQAEGWVMPATLFGGFNLVLLIGAAVWFFLRRRKGGGEGGELDELDELLAEADDAVADAGGDSAAQEEAA